MDESVLAMVLAGGQAKRMGVLCQETPKPALPFAGSAHVIDFALGNCLHSHVNRIAVLTDHLRDAMGSYVRQWRKDVTSHDKVNILEPKAGSYISTADAVYQNMYYINQLKPQTVLVLPSDHIYRMDYQKMLAFHRRVGAELTVGVVSVPLNQAHRFGNILVDDKGQMEAYIEKPEVPRSPLVSMGIFLFNTEVLAQELAEDARREKPAAQGFERGIIPQRIKKGRVFAYEFTGPWEDIGNPKAYHAANLNLVSPGNKAIQPAVRQGEKGEFIEQSEDGRIRNSILSPGCIVKGYVHNSLLSPDVYVEEQAVVRNSVLMNRVFVGYGSTVDHSILDEDVHIGDCSSVGLRLSEQKGHQDLTVLGKRVVVPAFTQVEANQKVAPDSLPTESPAPQEPVQRTDFFGDALHRTPL